MQSMSFVWQIFSLVSVSVGEIYILTIGVSPRSISEQFRDVFLMKMSPSKRFDKSVLIGRERIFKVNF